jgi:predicted ArsR family transcriptional regulator
MIRGYSCPLAAVAPDHPAVCHLAEALVSEIVGVPMHEECAREGRPRCAFVGVSPASG